MLVVLLYIQLRGLIEKLLTIMTIVVKTNERSRDRIGEVHTLTMRHSNVRCLKISASQHLNDLFRTIR